MDYVYFACAKMFGWTPAQVDNIEVYRLTSLLMFQQAASEVERERMPE